VDQSYKINVNFRQIKWNHLSSNY